MASEGKLAAPGTKARRVSFTDQPGTVAPITPHHATHGAGDILRQTTGLSLDDTISFIRRSLDEARAKDPRKAPFTTDDAKQWAKLQAHFQSHFPLSDGDLTKLENALDEPEDEEEVPDSKIEAQQKQAQADAEAVPKEVAFLTALNELQNLYTVHWTPVEINNIFRTVTTMGT